MTILSADFSAFAAIPAMAEEGAAEAMSITAEAPASERAEDWTHDWADGPPATDAGASAACANEQEEALPDDARLYLRHVGRGESIRAIARDTGCHASTIMRRIRRFEQRRDDPLVDGAMERVADAPEQGPRAEPANWTRHELDQARRILRRLAEPRAVMAVATGMDKAIVMRDDIRIAVLDRELAERIALMGWVALFQRGRITRHAITAAGRAALKHLVAGRGRMLPGQGDLAGAQPVTPPLEMAEAPAAFDHGEQHRVWGERDIEDPESGERRRARVNLAESPLLMFARRRDPAGKPFLDPGMVGAGERLREDFELAQMGPRVTQNWDRFMTAGIDSSFRSGAHGGGSEGARSRVAAALRDLGPGMGDLVLRVCCFLEGIEMTERRLGWPARSGKIVLRLALMRLERHYLETYGGGPRMIG
ncbi:DUF6456 domain-containing protein [Paracoccus sp. Z118]|uniref:DUF6456 domain-containing protein n=1 Tax=Paracoccus sp. Z118 TaxID=2851017 RepID=UPI0020B8670A|nr:DUF6456 domain-containing protein [Paracoccus sp. Z118]